MPGQWQMSLQQITDADGRLINGALAYFYEAETSDPKTPYAEYSLATPLPNPVVANSGRWPSVWLDDSTSSFFRVRVTDPDGVTLIDLTTCQVFSVAAGAETPPEPIDTTAVAETGDLKIRYDNNERTGWRICNGKSIGSATSGADYANANAQALFEYLWQKDSTLAVSGGRGASALADWSANKRLTLPDYKGVFLAGLDNMGGATAAGTLPDLTSLSARIGETEVTLVADNIPELEFTTTEAGGFSRNVNGAQATVFFSASGGGQNVPAVSTQTITVADHAHDGTVGTATPDAFEIIPPVAGFTIYIKL